MNLWFALVNAVTLTAMTSLTVYLADGGALEEQYLVVVWYNPFPIQAKRRVLSHERFQEGKQELERRFALVMNVMRQADLQVRALGDRELLAVMYRFYHWSLSPLGIGVMPRVLSMQPSLYVDVPRTSKRCALLSNVL